MCIMGGGAPSNTTTIYKDSELSTQVCTLDQGLGYF